MLRIQRAETTGSYKPPIEIEYVCKTDSTDLRLAYAATQIVFNWKNDPYKLRADGGPANGQHRDGKGWIPMGRFVTIRQLVNDSKMEVYVDGKLRGQWEADFSEWDTPVAIFSHPDVGPTLTVKSVRIRRPEK